MRPVSFTYTGTVGAPIDKVFALITDPSRMPEWLPGCQSVKPAPKLTGRGDRHRIFFERDGRRIDVEIEVIDYNPPYTYCWVEIRRRAGSRTVFALHIAAAATTDAHGRVSPVNTMARPGRLGPTKLSAVSLRPSASSIGSPFESFPHSGPSGMPAARAFSTSNRPRRSCSRSA